MRFLFDESADFRLIPYLLSLDHNVHAVSRQYPAGLSDEEVLAVAQNEHRILITADRDFGELVFQKRLQHAGIILMRLPGAALATKQQRLNHVLTLYADNLDKFLVVTVGRVRIRHIPDRRSP